MTPEEEIDLLTVKSRVLGWPAPKTIEYWRATWQRIYIDANYNRAEVIAHWRETLTHYERNNSEHF